MLAVFLFLIYYTLQQQKSNYEFMTNPLQKDKVM